MAPGEIQFGLFQTDDFSIIHDASLFILSLSMERGTIVTWEDGCTSIMKKKRNNMSK